MRLFRAWSVVDQFVGQEQVRIDWFVIGRTAPPAPYEELIRGYDENDDNACYDEILANELLLEPEIKELRSYLMAKHQIELQQEEVPLPIKSGTLSYGLLLISGEKGFYGLAEEPDYNLSITVLGHYDARVVDSVKLQQAVDAELGAEFLDIVFEHMQIGGMDRGEQRALLQRVFDETGLKVIRAKS